MLKTISVASCLFILFSVHVNAQQYKDQLRKEKAIQKDLAGIRQKISNTQQQTKASLGQLAVIQEKLQLRQEAIDHIDLQIGAIQASIDQSGDIIKRLTRELDTLKHQYEKSIVYSYQSRNNYDFLNFIFSGTSFNDVLKRIEYLKSYRLYREQQVIAIRQTQSLLEEKVAGLHTSRKEKDMAMQKQQQERLAFLEEKKAEDDLIARLKAREKELLKELAAKNKSDKELKAGINAAINRKLKKVPVAPEAPGNEIDTKNKGKYKFPETSDITTASVDFEKNRGKLPWPLENSVIKIHFGRYKVPGTSIFGYNPGLTFETEPGANVMNVLDGEVYSIFDVEGNYTVIIEYGKYFITYGNLESVKVVKGQKVETGQVIGTAAINNDEKGGLEFILMNIKNNIDPEPWLKKKSIRR